MVEKDKLLVVVSVLEGRRFPKRPRHKIVAEARFDGELISTDAVDHVESPDFTQELAWELDKKGLQQHRLQRTSIKIQCYAVDSSTSAREAIGYVVLDLRSAHNKQTSKWYPLLLGKYHKTKPEVRLSIYVEEDKSDPVNTSFKAKEAPARLVEDAPTRDVDTKFLKPVLNEDEGYYQLGPPKQCADHFVLSVTIATATNLAQLIPSTQPLQPGGGYFFYFSLFGNDVTNEVFHDLINPTFPAERASVRLRSSVDAIRMFLSSQPGIQGFMFQAQMLFYSTISHLKSLAEILLLAHLSTKCSRHRFDHLEMDSSIQTVLMFSLNQHFRSEKKLSYVNSFLNKTWF